MTNKKRAPAGADTLARAAGMTAGARSTPCKQTITAGEGNQGKIADLLGRGQAAAVPLAYLVAMTGMDGRTVRKMIERERRQGVPILSNNRSGYYLPGEDGEIASCVKSLRRRAGEIFKTARAIERAGKGGAV